MRRLTGRGRMAAALAALVAASVLAACSGGAPGVPPAAVGDPLHRAVPTSILHLPLTDQDNRSVTLDSWPGRVVLLVPSLTLCQDVCPFTTGVLNQVDAALRLEGAGSKVEIVELSVDPARDTPTRLAAYAQLTGARFTLVTESAADLATIARFFGFSYQKVPEDNPPSLDWLTGQPLTYDVDHSDGYVILNAGRAEIFANGAAPSYGGPLNPKLEQFLSPLGHLHQKHPPRPSYTDVDVLEALSWALGQSIPPASS
jgi:protein SCO1/2